MHQSRNGTFGGMSQLLYTRVIYSYTLEERKDEQHLDKKRYLCAICEEERQAHTSIERCEGKDCAGFVKNNPSMRNPTFFAREF